MGKRQKALDGTSILLSIKDQVSQMMNEEKDPEKLLALCALNNKVFDLFVIETNKQPEPQTPKSPLKRKRSPGSESGPLRSLFSADQMERIEEVFADSPYPNSETIAELAQEFK